MDNMAKLEYTYFFLHILDNNPSNKSYISCLQRIIHGPWLREIVEGFLFFYKVSYLEVYNAVVFQLWNEPKDHSLGLRMQFWDYARFQVYNMY
jgi:hypothetical protein